MFVVEMWWNLQLAQSEAVNLNCYGHLLQKINFKKGDF